MPVTLRNGVPVATTNPHKKPVWEMTKSEQEDSSTIVFDYDELLEFAEGNIAPVFGPQFSIIDNYSRRVRLPARDYLLVSRVTKMSAEPNVFRVGGSMTTEYDLPVNGELSLGGDIPWAILVESGQCDLMLISYMGIDFQCYGDRVYRLLDTTLTFYGVASEGETLVYDIKVNGFAKGASGNISMFFFEYNCYCNGKLLIEMRNGAAGFFTDEELAAGKGVLYTKAELIKREKTVKQDVTPFLVNPCYKKTTFSESDMTKLVNKKWKEVLGEKYDLDYRLTTPKMLMIDRVTHLDPKGGVHGLGLIIGEKILEREHWYFPCHFVKDEVMAGSLVSDGCSQMLKLYMVWLGLHDKVNNSFQFRPVDGQPNKVRCRGQISPHKGKLVYVMEIREMGFDRDGNPYAIADVDIIDVNFEKGQEFKIEDLALYGRGDLSRKIVVDFKGIALAMKKTDKAPVGAVSGSDRATLKGSPVPLNALSTDRNPPAEVSWHPLSGVMARATQKNVPKLFFYASKFPPRAICYTPFLKNKKRFEEFRAGSGPVDLSEILMERDLNFTPGVLPLNFYNMCEFMCGKVSNCLGDEFSKFDISKTSRSPAFDLALVTRVLKVNGLVKKEMLGVDVDPGKGEMIAEFDCPTDAWFFNKDSTHVPYSILMEIGLQTSGILTSWLKAPLTMKQKDILFRNLDATASMSDAIKSLDLRGRTIINKSVCTGYNMLGKMGIHRFTFELYLKEEDEATEQLPLSQYLDKYEGVYLNNKVPFYKGETSFGWFVPEVFESQVGLDNGKKKDAYFMENAVTNLASFNKINEASGKESFTNGDSAKKSLLRETTQKEYLDEIKVSGVNECGVHSKGYAYGKKTVDLSDWFFSCHFWNDPVMPGSLGIESMFQLMEFYLLHNNVVSNDKSWRFQHCGGGTQWKYRGQLSIKNKLMESEIHVKEMKVLPNGFELVADGFLFVDKLRVYEAKELRIQLVSSAKSSAVSTKIENHKVNTKLSLISNTSNGNKLSLVSNGTNGHASAISLSKLRELLLDVSKPISLSVKNSQVFNSGDGKIYPVTLRELGDSGFQDFYGVKANLYTGAMAKGIASADLVIAMGKANMLGSFGAGGLPMHIVERNIQRIKEELGDKPFSVNLIHSPFDPNLEEGNVELFSKYNVNVVEASAFMNLTLPVVHYRVRGLEVTGNNVVICNKLIAKCSRTEVAEMFLRPPPMKLLDQLFQQGKITEAQHRVAQWIPLADDVAIEADSGGHTDNRHMPVILPLVINLRNRLYKEYAAAVKANNISLKLSTQQGKILPFPYRVRVGGGGGVGSPESALCAFSLGAAFVVTGTINQLCKQSGTCDTVRSYLAGASYTDVTMAPAADMFDQGVQLQVLKKGTMFPSRAKKLYDLFCKYNSFEEFPPSELEALEKRILKKSLAEVWEETRDFYINRLHNPEKIERAETKDPKLKMSLCFRWYLGLSSFWANSGSEDRKTDYQVWCGPAIGAFNDFIKGSYLDYEVSKVYPCAVQANLHVLTGACYLSRLQQAKALGVDSFDPEIAQYTPDKPFKV